MRIGVYEVKAFANAVRQTARYQQTNLRARIMLAWAFRADAKQAAERLRQLEEVDFHFIRLDLTRIDSQNFRKDVAKLASKYADYESFLTFVSPPQEEVVVQCLQRRIYKFDTSDTIVMNAGAKIANVQDVKGGDDLRGDFGGGGSAGRQDGCAGYKARFGGLRR